MVGKRTEIPKTSAHTNEFNMCARSDWTQASYTFDSEKWPLLNHVIRIVLAVSTQGSGEKRAFHAYDTWKRWTWVWTHLQHTGWFARTGGISAETNFVLHLTTYLWTCIECSLSLQDEKVPKGHRSGENQATVFFWLVSHTSSVTISCRQEKTWLCKKHRSCYLDKRRHYRTTQSRFLHPEVWLLEPLGNDSRGVSHLPEGASELYSFTKEGCWIFYNTSAS